ncbi:TetR/AcrR family transcriptional regulator [Planctomonas sp. JC2975]|uniref:TetR/AcrR family transcriptional regulator n=1 Tax=Planctomonas sp. JC2975 TaxID=2729626 RepID=UPI00147533F5|nr:TetR/AcrR family transcriptional regulator [Planctomonas sp. JC2975]NNC13327.1 TetR/AcrR family transcriptional regulator [Planctomonas sp. JC2975]
MPAPTRTSNDAIVTAALDLVDSGGPDALTMQAVADRVGVRAPSLYKRVESRDHLLGLLVERITVKLASVLDGAADAETDDPFAGVVSMAQALRGFAHEHPHLFGLVFGQLPDAAKPPRESLARSAAAVLTVSERLAGPDAALDAARTITAWAYGFLTMELAGAFQLGGDPEAAFDYGAAAIARSIDARNGMRAHE